MKPARARVTANKSMVQGSNKWRYAVDITTATFRYSMQSIIIHIVIVIRIHHAELREYKYTSKVTNKSNSSNEEQHDTDSHK